MGFRSGELPGQIFLDQTVEKWSSKRAKVAFAVWAGAPSCMKTTERGFLNSVLSVMLLLRDCRHAAVKTRVKSWSDSIHLSRSSFIR